MSGDEHEFGKNSPSKRTIDAVSGYVDGSINYQTHEKQHERNIGEVSDQITKAQKFRQSNGFNRDALIQDFFANDDQ